MTPETRSIGISSLSKSHPGLCATVTFDHVESNSERLMDQVFTGLGLQFRYPAEWEISEEIGEQEACLTVSSSSTAFWSVTVIRGRPEPAEVMRAVVLAYEDEYEDLDLIESEIETPLRIVYEMEIDFVCFELTNTAFMRAFQTDSFTVLILYQFNDDEQDSQEQVLQQITDSLICESDLAPQPE